MPVCAINYCQSNAERYCTLKYIDFTIKKLPNLRFEEIHENFVILNK